MQEHEIAKLAGVEEKFILSEEEKEELMEQTYLEWG
jgi:hypothetical protein